MGTKRSAEDFHGAPYLDRLLELRNGPYLDFPAFLGIETLCLCNATCTFCPYPTLSRKHERMPDRLIAKILDDLADIPDRPPFSVTLSRVNEPFLDERIWDITADMERRFPEATHGLFSNGTPLTDAKLLRLETLHRVEFLNLSVNDHRPEAYEATMGLPFARTIARLDRIHEMKASGALAFPVLLSRVGDDTDADDEFLRWVEAKYPSFSGLVSVRCDWLGRVAAPLRPTPDVGCRQWFALNLLSNGKAAFCCVDAEGPPAGESVEQRHLIRDMYNHPARRRLRESLPSRLGIPECLGCPLLP